ncbi:MAG: CsgG/HfaB family protein [Stagnimonas sp.]|nr:CsgG/HfaB family protein [Stagnimonas sp.]
MRRVPRPALAILWLAALLPACTSTQLVRGEGDAIAAIRALPENARPRIAVLPVLDHTPLYGARSLDLNLVLVNLRRPEAEQLSKLQFTGSVRDMLVTELFSSKGFIVLEREGLPELVAEQAFADGGRFDPATVVKPGELEGAQYLVAAAITAFDTGSEGGAIPIPIPGVISSDVAALGVLNLGFKKGYVAMDVRVLDARTGRVLHSGAVEGSNTKLGVDLAAIAAARGIGITQVPNLIRVFKNTPVEQALQKMSIAAVAEIAASFQRPAAAP